MAVYESMQELIGNTPLVRLTQLGLPADARLYAKLETYNPAGSVKDRVGKYMIDAAERDGLLRPGGTIIEATAGNTGLGIAFAALGRGYRVIFVVPTKFSQEKQTLMRALGAEILNTPREDGMLGAAAKAEELRASIPGAVMLGQFRNPANPLSHYETTGPEIYRDLEGKIDYFVAGAGRGVLADPLGSTIGGGEHADYDIEGIGNDFIPETMDISLVDQVIKISDTEAFAEVKELAAKEGLIVGTSSGAAVAAAKKLIENGARGNIVTLLPDRGERYFSKHLYD